VDPASRTLSWYSARDLKEKGGWPRDGLTGNSAGPLICSVRHWRSLSLSLSLALSRPPFPFPFCPTGPSPPSPLARGPSIWDSEHTYLPAHLPTEARRHSKEPNEYCPSGVKQDSCYRMELRSILESSSSFLRDSKIPRANTRILCTNHPISRKLQSDGATSSGGGQRVSFVPLKCR